MEKRFIIVLLAAFLALAPAPGLSAQSQELDSLVALAQMYHESYRFADAMDAWTEATEVCSDSLEVVEIEGERAHSSSAFRMMGAVSDVHVVARQRFSVDDFFLYYPLPDHSWRKVDGALPVYCPEAVDTLFYNGARNYSRAYTVAEGDRMYFAADEADGIGGYDLYYCDWDPFEKRWGEPHNMGFPFSSPGDDILFMNTPDGQYSIFASNRDCQMDSVYVYVLERWDPISVSMISDPDDLAALCSLEPQQDVKKTDISSATGKTIEEDAKVAQYRLKTEEVRDLREKLSVFNGTEEEKAALTAALHAAKEEIEEIEMYFLSNGTAMDLEQTRSELEHEVAPTDGAYVFTRKSMGSKIVVVYTD